MVLKLDPRLPLVWRSPDGLQFGVDRPAAVIDRLTPTQERLVAALVAGVSRSGLEMIAQAAESPPGLVEALLARLAPALLSPPGRQTPAIAVEGSGPTADEIARLIDAAGAPESPDLVVIVGHHVIEPELHGRWLRNDIPHLPVVFGDRVVHIGPMVEPGRGPCLYCLERYRTDADPAWPAIASQLWGRPAASETPIAAAEAAAIAARIALRRLEVGEPSPATSIELDAITGDQVRRTWRPHPECHCISLGPNELGPNELGPNEPAVSEDPPGSATAAAARRGPIRISPRTGATVAWRG